ncbi:Trehalose transport system permease protein SugA [Actinomadura rubteroloni]|uniref:Trehalose transport system permease protein SugA n=1 Tax=Actinomadura rubteroloni TaxID=1926885 RepID=A0A2P4UAX2_9ACTN|nr:ABC transporter permease subunit [Actinomadura rubteroloni]POM22194.1 Trehalose transport system permease protein SugA [Actinomadura rubteroloni]
MMAPREDTPPATAGAATGGAAATGPDASTGRRDGLRPPSWLAGSFLLPALLLLGFLVVYPIVYTVVRSFLDSSGGFTTSNYTGIFEGHGNLLAVRNTAIWVVVAPTLVTIVGLLFAVLTERIRWATAFKLVVFMPMAISFLASGVIFRLVYEQDPDKGVANAAMVAVHDAFSAETAYPGAGPRAGAAQPLRAEGGAVVTARPVTAGSTALLPLLRVKPEYLPAKPVPARAAAPPGPGRITGTVWFDFTRGGGGRPNAVDPSEAGLPGVRVQAVRDGKVVASATTRDDGTFTLAKVPAGPVTLRLPAGNFTAAYGGAEWLGDTLITPAIIGAYLWVWSGFAMVLIAAGLAAIPRDALEAARVDGATEWQVFRRVTIPLLSPVLVVVLVTLVINVLKVFDLVFVIGGGDPNAGVLALQMWTESFGGGNDQGAGSAIAVLLFLLVLPAMLFNIRRLRRERK